MSEHLDKLRAAVARLEQELHSVKSLDSESRELLESARKEIQEALGSGETSSLEAPTLVDRLNGAVEDFEVSHPTLAGVVRRLVDGLTQLGI